MTEEKKTTPVEKVEKKEKKEPKVKARKPEELTDVPVKQMTEKEKECYIKKLREDLALMDTKCAHYKMNAESAYEKVQLSEKNFNSMEDYYKKREQFIKDSLNNFVKTMALLLEGRL